jgi:hypothetical protein
VALTPAEKQKRYRERQKQAQKAAPDLATGYLRMPFYKWLGDGYERAELMELAYDLNAAGFELPEFDDDSGPSPFKGGLVDPDAEWHAPYEGYSGSVGRAESMVHYLLAAAARLAGLVNDYKLEEINARIAEIQQADLSDPADKAKALADIVTLQGLKARLDGKTFRRSFAEFSVKGSYPEK